MTFKFHTLALAAICASAAGTAAAEGIEFKFSGFGTLGVTIPASAVATTLPAPINRMVPGDTQSRFRSG